MAAQPESSEVWEARPGAARWPLAHYRRREPEHTILHTVVRERLESFLATARERSANGRGLPSFVERDLRGYLDCGILARGFVRVRCPDCSFERLVAFSCKAHICPSCAARRMEDGAAHLVRNVFPAVPVRQWVLSLPRRVRFLAAREATLASRLLSIFIGAVFAWQRRRARRLGVAKPQTGGVTAIQRFGGALNLNVHFHSLMPDGTFVISHDGTTRFVPSPAPSDEEVDAILRRVIRRAAKVVSSAANSEDREDALAELQAAEVDRGQRSSDPFQPQRRSANLDGWSLHAGVRIHENDHEGREKLFRYALRPPLALQRLSMGEDGRLLYQMKRPRNGALVLSLTPDELLAKLATLVPPPRVHNVRYHGLFAPDAKLRSRVVPSASPAAGAHAHASPAGSLASLMLSVVPEHLPCAPALPPAGGEAPVPDLVLPAQSAPVASSGVSAMSAGARRAYRIPWSELLKKVFAIDVLACPVCNGRMKIIAYIASATVARRILEHLGLPATGPPLAKTRLTECEGYDPAPDYEQAEPSWDE